MATFPVSQEFSHVNGSFILKMEAVCFSVTAGAIYETTRHQIAQINNYKFFGGFLKDFRTDVLLYSSDVGFPKGNTGLPFNGALTGTCPAVLCAPSPAVVPNKQAVSGLYCRAA